MDRPDFEAIPEQIIALKLGVVTLPAANLYLQGRDCEKLPPRGLTRVAEIVRSGVPIATASDNIEDPSFQQDQAICWKSRAGPCWPAI